MVIAVDFDGTIVENKYPEIGQELPFAIETLKMLIKDRHRVVLWTCREGEPPLHTQTEGRHLHRRPQHRRSTRLGHYLSDGYPWQEMAPSN